MYSILLISAWELSADCTYKYVLTKEVTCDVTKGMVLQMILLFYALTNILSAKESIQVYKLKPLVLFRYSETILLLIILFFIKLNYFWIRKMRVSKMVVISDRFNLFTFFFIFYLNTRGRGQPIDETCSQCR